MPKRRNPFGEITPLQRKMHVGFEQMATQEEKQAVFGEHWVCLETEFPATCVFSAEKTKGLLFLGAMNLPVEGAKPIRGHQTGDHHSFEGGPQCQLLSSRLNGACPGTVPIRDRDQPGLLNYFASSRVTGEKLVTGGGGEGVRG